MNSVQTQNAQRSSAPKGGLAPRRRDFSLQMLCLLLALLFPAALSAQISGTVFRDYNANGTKDSANEPGVAGLTVTAYNAANAVVDATTTAADGTYSLIVPAATAVRVEVTGLASGDQPGAAGKSTVFFATAPASGQNVGVNNPVDYNQANPDLATPCYIQGDPLVAGTAASLDVLVKWAYNNSGTSPAPTHLADGSEIGSTWGLAWARISKKLYSAAFLKRHVGLGPNGLGAIYVTDLSGAPTNALFVDLATLGASVGTIGSNAARGLTGNALALSADPTTYDQIGKLGLGDIDISDDESTLWVVSLNDKTSYALVIDSDNNPITPPTAGDLTGYPIPDPGCVGGAWRPFALKFYHGDVYVGGVCDAQTSQLASNMSATVYRFTPGPNTFTSILSFALNYPRSNGICAAFPGWYPWTSVFPATDCAGGSTGNTSYPQPVLSDIEFDIEGSMVLGIFDRFGHQSGRYQNNPAGFGTFEGTSAGDILRAFNSSGTLVLESNATAGPNTTGGAGNGQGPGGGEYYFQDSFGSHHEVTLGGLSLKLGSGEVVSTVYDPLTTVRSGGIHFYSNTTGAKTDAYQIYVTDQTGTQGKAAGLGDLELLVDPAPIEIGNFVWCDDDGDGIQDPGEAGIASVPVYLKDANGNQIASTTTDASGQYLFNSSNVTGGLQPNTAYQICVATNSAALGTKQLTTKDYAGNAGNSDLHDSDAMIVGPNAQISVTTGDAGENNHTHDFGFVPAAKLGNFVWEDTNGNGIQDSGEPPIVGATVILCDANGNPVPDVNGNSTLQTNAQGEYCFYVNAGTYIIKFPTPAGYVTCAKDQGTNDQLDSDYDPANNNQTAPVTIASGQINNSIDAGFKKPAKLGNFVWEDLNGNGIQDSGEPPIVGATVILCDANGNPVPDVNGNSSLQTNAQGDKIYVVDTRGDSAAIHDVNPLTGMALSVVNVVTASGQGIEQLRALAWNPDNGMLYGVIKPSNELVRINPTTGVSFIYPMPVVAQQLNRQIEGLAFREENSQQVLYGIDENKGEIYTIAYTGSGAGTLVCNIGITGFTTIDFGANGEVFAANRITGKFYLLDLNACTATVFNNGINLPRVQGITYKPCPIWDLPVLAQPISLSLNKNASASSTTGSFLPARAVDGNRVTAWKSGKYKANAPEWLKVDLGVSQTVGRVVIAWLGKSYASKFDVQISTNGSAWTTVASRTRNKRGTDDVSFAMTSARYVRVWMTKGSKYFEIAELEVYANASLPKSELVAADEDAEESPAEIPDGYALHQNYPNPFNPATMISFTLAEAGKVTVSVYSETGQLVRTLADAEMPAGQHEVRWNSRNQSGQVVAAGVYLYQIVVQDQAGNTVFTETRRMTMVK